MVRAPVESRTPKTQRPHITWGAPSALWVALAGLLLATAVRATVSPPPFPHKNRPESTMVRTHIRLGDRQAHLVHVETTLDDVSASMGLPGPQVQEFLDSLRSERSVQELAFEGKTYYTVGR